MTNIKSPKKLIEVALPLDAINFASGKEKSVRHGHPSTLHLWWARRPLAAARAVIFSQMVNDPSEMISGDKRTKEFKERVERKRQDLFGIMEDLVRWENTNNEEVLEKARNAILESWWHTCEINKNHPDAEDLFNPSELPSFHDPFAGGGAIPLEAKRLGFRTYATDLNPIPVMINRCLIEAVGRFGLHNPVSVQAKGLLDKGDASAISEDFKNYAGSVLRRTKDKVGDNYPYVKVDEFGAGEHQVITWLWCRAVKSPNPAAQGGYTPLIKNPVLSKRNGVYTWVNTVVNDAGEVVFKVVKSKEKPEAAGTVGRKGATCLHTGTPIPLKYIREQGRKGEIKHFLMAAVVMVGRKKVFMSGSEVEVPDVPYPEEVPENDILHWSGCTNVCVYGMTRFKDLFSSRQASAMLSFSKCIGEIHGEVESDAIKSGLANDNVSFYEGGSGARAYADAICYFLTCCLGRAADYWNTLTSWEGSGEFVAHAFTKHALPMIWDYGEVNPFSESGGSWLSGVDWISRVIEKLPSGEGSVFQHNAVNPIGVKNTVISTDPPYYDNVPYSNLSDFFYIWSRIALRGISPNDFSTIQTPKKEEIVASHSLYPDMDEAMSYFSLSMSKALESMCLEANPSIPVTIYYAFKQSDTSDAGTYSSGWSSFLESVISSGFSITGTWPIRTERSSRGRAIGSNALASSIVLVCRKREKNASSISRREFQRQLREEMPEALETMIGGETGQAPIAPVDLAQAAIGPGMAIYSQYEAVLNQDGSRMSVHDALVLINRAITDFLTPDSGNFDADTQFCAGWFDQYAWSEGPFGEADTLARAKGTGVDGVREAGVIESGTGKVRLLKWGEYQSEWDPTTDKRTPVWEACHQMIRRLQNHGESAAGELLAKMPEKGEAIRQLAYHLYTLCERKKWAEEARAYNELIGSWHAIVAASHETGHTNEQVGLDL